MATYYLINPVKFGLTLLWPGSYVDSAYDDVAGIQAAGGVLVASSDATVAAASPNALAVRLRGGEMSEAATIMMLAYSSSGTLAAGSVSATELATGAVEEAKLAADAVTNTKIADGTIQAAKLANGAGLAALIAAGLGASVNVAHDASSPVTLLAADATHDRAVVIVAVCTESMAGTGEPTFDCGWTGTADGIIDQTLLAGATAGDVFVGAGNVPATDDILATVVDGGGTPTGAWSFTVFALPNP